jgi:hypothetical protein
MIRTPLVVAFVALACPVIAQLESPSAVEAIALGPSEIKVYWNPAHGAAMYAIRRDGVAIGMSGPDTNTYSDSHVQAGKTYTYDVAALDSQGNVKAGRPYVERAFDTLPDRSECDVLVVGATTAGVSAAITSARYGLNVVLIEETRRLGGMPVNGLGSTDLRRLNDSSGLFEEFRRRVQSIYGTGDGLMYEPRVAHQAIKEMVWGEPRLIVHRQVRPVKVTTENGRITEVVAETVPGGRRVAFHARIVVDATECGDVAAWAGAPFRVGREGRTAREPHAGHIFYDRAGDRPVAASTGQADQRVQAYAYLMTVEDYGPGADKTIPKPPGYDPRKYEHAPKFDVSWAVTSGKLPNHKYEVNQHPQGSDLQVVNYPYPTTTYAERRRIEQAFKDHALGYLYYIQTVEGKKNIGLSEDDYRDSGNWPQLLYIREARRFEGSRVLDETDISNRPIQPNAIGLADYPMDSHAVQPKSDWTTPDMGEGEFYLPQHTPWHQPPYDVMIPRRLINVFVPTAVSATHVAYGTLRLEPVRMHFGEAAGIASYLALRYGVQPRDVPARQIQDELVKVRTGTSDRPALDGFGAPGPSADPAKLYAFSDVNPALRKYRAIEWLAARGFYPAPPPPMPRTPAGGLASPAFDADAPATTAEAAHLLNLLAARARTQSTLRADPTPAIVTAQADGPLTRIAAARMLVAAMGWKSAQGGNHFADLPDSADSRAAEILFEHWIDPRLWDAWPKYSEDGKMLFRPSEPVTRQQLAEMVWLAHFYAGPLWLDYTADRLPNYAEPPARTSEPPVRDWVYR